MAWRRLVKSNRQNGGASEAAWRRNGEVFVLIAFGGRSLEQAVGDFAAMFAVGGNEGLALVLLLQMLSAATCLADLENFTVLDIRSVIAGAGVMSYLVLTLREAQMTVISLDGQGRPVPVRDDALPDLAQVQRLLVTDVSYSGRRLASLLSA